MAAAAADGTGAGSAAGGRKSYFAALGDVHGQFRHAARLLSSWEAEHGRQLAFALQVGDLECHRDEADLATMAAPARKRHLGDFQDLASGALQLPCPVLFIGGNHECYGWLDEDDLSEAVAATLPELQAALAPAGTAAAAAGRRRPKQVANNLFYLGRAGYVTFRLAAGGGLRFAAEDAAAARAPPEDRGDDAEALAALAAALAAGAAAEVHVPARASSSSPSTAQDAPEEEAILTVAGLSGIYQEASFYQRRPLTSAFGTASNKSWIGFNCYDVARLLADAPPAAAGDAEVGGLREQLGRAIGRCLGRGGALTVDALLSRQALLKVFWHAADSGWEAGRAAQARFEAWAAGRPWTLDTLLSFYEERLAGASAARRAAFVQRFDRSRAVDVLMTHDWPAGLLPEGVQLRGSRPMGNDTAREVCEALRPQLHLCGHMHTPLRKDINVVKSPDALGIAGRTTEQTVKVCCLSKVGYSHAAAFFEYDWATGVISELDPPTGLADFAGPGDDVDSGSDD